MSEPARPPNTAGISVMRQRLPFSTHWTLLILLFVYVMSFLDRQIMGILIQPIKTEFGVSDTAMGVLSGVTFALFYSTLAIPFARYADRANRRNLVSYCCAAWSAMTAMCGLAGSYWTLALARVGVAVGEAGGTAPSITMVADHYPPEQRGRAMSVYMLGPQLGILFGLGLGGWIAHHYGWRQFRAMGASALDISAVASGSFDGFVDMSPDAHGVWDYLGAMLVVREAGGVVVDAAGRDLTVLDHAARRTPVAATNGPLLDELLEQRRRS